jgi:hypothetical protein
MNDVVIYVGFLMVSHAYVLFATALSTYPLLTLVFVLVGPLIF